MTDQVIFSRNGNHGEPNSLGAYDDFAAGENRSVDFAPGLVSLGFIKAAIWRSTRFLFVMAVVGLLGGVGYFVSVPHSYQASASVLLTLSSYENNLTASVDNQAIAETSAVAELAMQKLGLKENAGKFLKSYSVASDIDRLLTITASASSPNQAVVNATAVGNAFLKFRADQLRGQNNLVLQSLGVQANQARQHVSSIDAQLRQLQSQPTSSTQQSQISKLQVDQTSAATALSNLQDAISGNQTNTAAQLNAALDNSRVLSVTPLPYSKTKKLVTYGLLGVIGGLAVGLAIVIVRALMSDRLRRRDDIAYALDAPVRLSVTSLGARRTLTPRPGRAAKRNLDMQRVIAHLHSAVPRGSQVPASLAIVAVDNGPVVARAAAALATSYASQGAQVVAADLSSGAYLAHLAGVKGSGVQTVSRDGVNFMLAVPDRDNPVPAGPLPVTSSAQPAHAGDALIAPGVAADLLLTLVTLDPALGGEHLATWAANAVVVVSAGQSSAERIHGVGEMVRLAGMRLDSVILIGADKRDESLGLVHRSDEQAGVGVLGR